VIKDEKFVILVSYVDDLFISSSHVIKVEQLKVELQTLFKKD
jgi:hypothetical protein